MPTLEDARELARSMANVAARAGLPSVMLLTDLREVLGASVGNAVGVQEVVEFLAGRHRDAWVLELLLEIVAEMLVMGGISADLDAGRQLATERLEDGSAAARFDAMVEAMGGPADFSADSREHLPAAAVVSAVEAERPGFVSGTDPRAIGHALVALGGGRRRPDDTIDFAVGFSDIAAVGEPVGYGAPLAVVHAPDEAHWQAAAGVVRKAIRVSPEAPPPLAPIVRERLRSTP
jgi:thymidine phosphorylase